VTSDEIRPEPARALDRRTLIKGGLGLLAGGLALEELARGARAVAAPPRAVALPMAAPTGSATQQLHLAATDGWASLPAATPRAPFWPDPLAPPGYDVYVFGFRDVTSVPANLVVNERGKAQICAPVLGFDQYDPAATTGATLEERSNAVRITLSNLGLSVRPDLTDGHTIHWHGFTNAIPLFDGVPELSISVPIGREFTYYYRPHEPGTYMYHCHFEDVEHVQMGMTGVVYVRPLRNTPTQKFAYDAASTAYDREFAFMLTELWVESHYRDAHIQTTDWTDFKPSFWLLNGRAFPDTLKPSTDPLTTDQTSDSGANLRYNPVSSLVAANVSERVLLRLANLGYQHHAMTLDGIPMRVIAKDASPLVDTSRDLSFETNTVEIGPGESRDVIITMPSTVTPDSGKPYQAFRLYDRNYAYLNNGGDAGYGGQMTEVRLFPAGTPTSAHGLTA